MNLRRVVVITFFVLASILILSGCNNGINSSERQAGVYFKGIFDQLDSQVNNGNGYKDCLNTDGCHTGALLAWSESYLTQAYAEMFRATGDERYLDKLSEHIESVMRNRDDFRGEKDYKGELVPAWGANRHTGGDWKHFVVHTGMITYPMLEFVELLREHEIEDLYEEGNVILSRVEESVRYHDSQWVPQETGRGLYVFRQDYYGKENYVMPLSQQAAMGRSLILLWQLTHNEDYRQKAEDIAVAVEDSMSEDGKDGYIWGVFPGSIGEGNHVADISHSTITLHFASLAYEGGLAFTRRDVNSLAATMKRLWKDGRIPDYVDGTGGFSYEITAGQYAFLARYDPDIWNKCYELLFSTYRVDVTAKLYHEDWWGTVMLGIARLAHNAKYIETGESSQ